MVPARRSRRYNRRRGHRSARALCVPIGGLRVVDHVGSPQRLEPLGLLGARSRRDHPSAQNPGELQRKDRNTPGTLDQDGISRDDRSMARQCYPRDRGSQRTPRWREMDSNYWYRGTKSPLPKFPASKEYTGSFISIGAQLLTPRLKIVRYGSALRANSLRIRTRNFSSPCRELNQAITEFLAGSGKRVPRLPRWLLSGLAADHRRTLGPAPLSDRAGGENLIGTR
jgi:hypothetical protein